VTIPLPFLEGQLALVTEIAWKTPIFHQPGLVGS